MQLMLRVSSPRTSTVEDVVTTVELGHTVADLCHALRQVPGLDGNALTRSETGGALDPAMPLRSVGLVSGDELVLGDPGPAAPPVASTRLVRIESVHGPASGWRADLVPGSTCRVGRKVAGAEADPTYFAIPDDAISRNHLTVHVDARLGVTVTESPEAVNKMLIDGTHASGAVRVAEGSELSVGDSILRVRTIEARPAMQVDQLGQVAFHRTPLRPAKPVMVELAALARVPNAPEPTRFSWLATAAPAIGGVLMAGLMGEPRFLIFVLLSPITAVASFFEGRKRTQERYQREVEAFEKRLDARRTDLSAAYDAERTARLAAAPDVADLRRRAEQHERTLWCRGRQDQQFLSLRVGLGSVPTHIQMPDATEGEQEFVDKIEALQGAFAYLDGMPIGVPMAEVGALGVQGNQRDTSALAESMLIQAACLHSPEDLVIVAAVSPATGLLSWLRWLPHCRSTGSPLGSRHLADDKPSADRLLRQVLEVADFRASATDQKVDRRWPWVLLVIDRSLEADPHLVAQLLDRSPEAGISVLWITDTLDRVPRQCRAVVTLGDRSLPGAEQLSTLAHVDPDVAVVQFSADATDREAGDAVARALAPLRDASSATATTSIPRMVSLFDAHAVDGITTAWVQEQWSIDRTGPGGYAIQAVVGMAANSPMTLDLVSDGPHGLIGGTSGAGKSELIQAIVAGLVAYQSPRDLSLMFIDFKGGSASEVFKDLPHVAGRVTDLDEATAMRARVALRAELRRRGSLFSSMGVNDMAAFRRRFPADAPPSLVIVIDEFATLVKQLPLFVADLIDIAQRGRSYGIHLLLATQRPSASVDDNILANTNLRISLRMLDQAESTSILNAPDAALIPVPLKGRCLARMGPGQLVEFQSAYCSAPLPTSGGRPPVTAVPLDPLGLAPGQVLGVEPAEADADAPTQLDALVRAVRAIGHERVEQIWQPELPPHLALDEAAQLPWPEGIEPEPGRTVLIGGADDPANRSQPAAVVDLAVGGGLLVLGAGASGKSTLLQTIGVQVALDDSRAGGGTAAIFVLDFASGALAGLKSLPQCDGMGTADDLESTTRIIETLRTEVLRRRAQTGWAPGVDPRLVLLIDGYHNLASALTEVPSGQEQTTDLWFEALNRLIIDGRQFGVHAVLTAERAGGLRTAVYASVTQRLVLRQPDEAETRAAGVPQTSTFPPGAGYLGPLRVQVAALPQEAAAIEVAFAGLEESLPDQHHRLLSPPLPAAIDRPKGSGREGWSGMVGVADLTAEPVSFELSNADLLVAGPAQSGKSWALRSLAEGFEHDNRPVYVIGPTDSGLRSFSWRAAAWGGSDAIGLLGSLKAELRPGREVLLVIDDLERFVDLDGFSAAIQGWPDDGSVKLLVAMTGKPYQKNPAVTRARTAQQVLYLQPASAREVADQVDLIRLPPLRLGLEFPPGRGVFLRRRVPTVVQAFAPLGA